MEGDLVDEEAKRIQNDTSNIPMNFGERYNVRCIEVPQYWSGVILRSQLQWAVYLGISKGIGLCMSPHKFETIYHCKLLH